MKTLIESSHNFLSEGSKLRKLPPKAQALLKKIVKADKADDTSTKDAAMNALGDMMGFDPDGEEIDWVLTGGWTGYVSGIIIDGITYKG